MTTPGATCRFCAEALPAGATKCSSCGEAAPPPAALKWERDGVVVVTPGDMPIGVCFGCGEVGPTRPRREYGPSRGGRAAREEGRAPPTAGVVVEHVDVPTCAACSRRAGWLPLVVSGAVVAGLFMALTGLAMIDGARVGPLTVGWALFLALALVGLLLIAHHLGRTRVRARWAGGEVRLRLADARAVRRAVERDGI